MAVILQGLVDTLRLRCQVRRGKADGFCPEIAHQIEQLSRRANDATGDSDPRLPTHLRAGALFVLRERRRGPL